MNKLTVQTLSTIKLAAKKLSGSKRRAFQAQVTKDYLGGSGRRAERVFGVFGNYRGVPQYIVVIESTSFLAYQQAMQQAQRRNNAQSLFGLEPIPGD